MADVQFARIDDNWALASDGVQWVLQRFGGVDRRNGKQVWQPVSFVRSSRDVLARCMREKCVPDDAAWPVLASLPASFEEWAAGRAAGLGSEFPAGGAHGEPSSVTAPTSAAVGAA